MQILPVSLMDMLSFAEGFAVGVILCTIILERMADWFVKMKEDKPE